MDNCIKYVASGKSFSIPCDMSFNSELSGDSIATRIYLEISWDVRSKIASGEIAIKPTEEEAQKMTDEEKKEWLKVTNIEFLDNSSRKAMRMNHMSDFIANYRIDTF